MGPKRMMLTEHIFLFFLSSRSAPTDGSVGILGLSPFYENQLVPLLSVLKVGETLKGKLAEDETER
jgi:hypothetical protein